MRGGSGAPVRSTTLRHSRHVRRREEAISRLLDWYLSTADAADDYLRARDRHSEGGALNNLGLALAGVRRSEEAITACQDAAAISRETGDRHGEDWSLEVLARTKEARDA